MPGDSPPMIPGRYTPDNSNSSKKYSSTSKSVTLNTTIGNRNNQARARLFSKISAPRPINTPSLKSEHAVGSEPVSTSPATSHGWGSSSSTSPSFTQSIGTKSPSLDTTESTSPQEENTHCTSSKTPGDMNTTKERSYTHSPPRAWSIPTNNTHNDSTEYSGYSHSNNKHSNSGYSHSNNGHSHSNNGHSHSNNSNTHSNNSNTHSYTPTPQPAAPTDTHDDIPTHKKDKDLYDDKEYLKYAFSDPNHTSWDEMANDDADFSVDVVEFDDGTKIVVDEEVSPAERFTEDYDRTYPPQRQNVHDRTYKYRRPEEAGYNSRYQYENRRRSTESAGNEDKRHSSEKWNNRRDSTDNKNVAWGRRPSHDRKNIPPTTLLQRPRKTSDNPRYEPSHDTQDSHSSVKIVHEPKDDERPPEITVAQREVMLTAAERAKKRRDEEEAEFEAARERARQKAAALAAALADSSKKSADTKKMTHTTKKPVVEASSAPPVTTPIKSADPAEKDIKTQQTITETTPVTTHLPWSVVAAKKESDQKKESDSTPVDKTSSVLPRQLTGDEANWEDFVKNLKSQKTVERTSTANDWNSYASRLQTVCPLPSAKTTQLNDIKVEVTDYTEHEDWGYLPNSLNYGRNNGRGGWIRSNDNGHGRGTRAIRGDSDRFDRSMVRNENDRYARNREERRPSFTNQRHSKNYDTWRQSVDTDKPVLSILKHEAATPESKELERKASADSEVERSDDANTVTETQQVKSESASPAIKSGQPDQVNTSAPVPDSVDTNAQVPPSVERIRQVSPSALKEAEVNQSVSGETIVELQLPDTVHTIVEPNRSDQASRVSQSVESAPLSFKSRISLLFKDSSAPIFPEIIQKLAGIKLTISFMVDNEDEECEVSSQSSSVQESLPATNTEPSEPVLDENTSQSVSKESASQTDPVPNEKTSQTDPVNFVNSWNTGHVMTGNTWNMEPASSENSWNTGPVVSKSRWNDDVVPAWNIHHNGPSTSDVVHDSEIDGTPSQPVPNNNVPLPDPLIDDGTASTTSNHSRQSTPTNLHKHNSPPPEFRRMGSNPCFPVLVYQFPSQQPGKEVAPDYNPPHKDLQRAMGVYFMRPQQYMPGNQYTAPFPRAGTGNQPVYIPTMPWKQPSAYSRPFQNRRAPGYRGRFPHDYETKDTREWIPDNQYNSRGMFRKGRPSGPSRGGRSSYTHYDR
ncbi:hypothetical protein BDB01DRAFT_207887 [Pilobolus umbonatus]|nr:hypothetical protein BDB01DRAFT_207887 [Pilobolus umbonatus]